MKILKITQDPNPPNPRYWNPIGTIIYNHPKYILGDYQIDKENYSSWQDVLEKEILDVSENPASIIYLPIYLLDHSSISISTSDFNNPWDSGQVGYIYMERTPLHQDKSDIQLKQILKSEISDFNKYLQGDCYGFELIESEICSHCNQTVETVILGEEWGIYANNEEELKEEISQILKDSNISISEDISKIIKYV